MLTLPIKKKWFDMILSGEKKEEYREFKPFYTVRFRNYWGYPAYWSEPHFVELRNGYLKDSPRAVVRCSLARRCGREEWGAEQGKVYYVLIIHSVYEYCDGCFVEKIFV